jgi:hypothetical protein
MSIDVRENMMNSDKLVFKNDGKINQNMKNKEQ